MRISEYQQWLKAWDEAREFDKADPGLTVVHALEELGEVAREVLFLKGYKKDFVPEEHRQALANELADTIVFLFKLAYQYDIDIEDALLRLQDRVDKRFPESEPGWHPNGDD
jgi:NTP pyrophosphatase (non-canonical NTP hydrolase)